MGCASMSGRLASFGARVATVAMWIAVASCDGPPGPLKKGARILLVPEFSAQARAGAASLDVTGVSINNVRLKLTRPPATSVIDTSISVPAGADSVIVDLTLPNVTVGETLGDSLQFRN